MSVIRAALHPAPRQSERFVASRPRSTPLDLDGLGDMLCGDLAGFAAGLF
jgi:hypothetical protein